MYLELPKSFLEKFGSDLIRRSTARTIVTTCVQCLEAEIVSQMPEVDPATLRPDPVMMAGGYELGEKGEVIFMDNIGVRDSNGKMIRDFNDMSKPAKLLILAAAESLITMSKDGINGGVMQARSEVEVTYPDLRGKNWKFVIHPHAPEVKQRILVGEMAS